MKKKNLTIAKGILVGTLLVAGCSRGDCGKVERENKQLRTEVENLTQRTEDLRSEVATVTSQRDSLENLMRQIREELSGITL